MHDTDTTELYVRATPGQVALAVPPRAVAGRTTFTVAGSWHTAPWGPTLEVWRREGRWERGRAGGRATVDLVPAGTERTLVLVTLTPDRRRPAGRRHPGAAATLAGQVRALAESRATAMGHRPLPHRGDATAPASDPFPALPAAAVGYSGP